MKKILDYATWKSPLPISFFSRLTAKSALPISFLSRLTAKVAALPMSLSRLAAGSAVTDILFVTVNSKVSRFRYLSCHGYKRSCYVSDVFFLAFSSKISVSNVFSHKRSHGFRCLFLIQRSLALPMSFLSRLAAKSAVTNVFFLTVNSEVSVTYIFLVTVSFS